MVYRNWEQLQLGFEMYVKNSLITLEFCTAENEFCRQRVDWPFS